jgi:hypothetical protein
VYPLFVLIFIPAALIGSFKLAAKATATGREGRSAAHFALASVALGFLSLVLAVHAIGQWFSFYFMVDEQCRARGAGEYIEYRDSLVPLSGELECTDRTIQLVPAWVNPAMTMLSAACVLAVVAAAIAWGRFLLRSSQTARD